MSGQEPRRGLGVIGFGVAACAVCCAGPLLGALGGLGLAGLVSAWSLGGTALVAVATAATVGAVVRRRHRRTTVGTARPQAVPVAAPVRRAP